MKNLDPLTISGALIKQIGKGAFLTAKAGDALNTMTIGWGMFGFIWQRRVFVVPVRDSRHTFSIMEKAMDFTVTIPTVNMKDALAFCGSKSGRDLDKFEACALKVSQAQHTVSPIIDVPGIHLECRICYKAPMDPKFLDPALMGLYPEMDFHTLYYGEIVACYEIEAAQDNPLTEGTQ